MIFDLHVSTAMSGNGLISPEDLIDLALDLGLGGLGITERRGYEASEVCVEFAAGLPLVILRGLEIETDLGDMLIFGLTAQTARPLEGATKWTALEAVEYVGRAGGVCVPAHPFDKERRSVGDKLTTLPGVFVVEGLNGRATDEENQAALRFAEEFGLKAIGGSDALVLGQVGSCVTEFERPVRDEAEFLAELRAGRFAARYWNKLPISQLH